MLDTTSLSRHLKTISKKKKKIIPTPTEILLMEQDKFPYLLSDFALFMNNSRREGAANRDESMFREHTLMSCTAHTENTPLFLSQMCKMTSVVTQLSQY